jgi:hypothetical protein
MKRWYIFLIQGSWRTRDIEAHTLKQAYRIAKKEYKNVLDSYQTCPLTGTTFSGWKEMNERRTRNKR